VRRLALARAEGDLHRAGVAASPKARGPRWRDA